MWDPNDMSFTSHDIIHQPEHDNNVSNDDYYASVPEKSEQEEAHDHVSPELIKMAKFRLPETKMLYLVLLLCITCGLIVTTIFFILHRRELSKETRDLVTIWKEAISADD